MENTQEIFEYLPLAYKNTSDAEYFDFLIYSVQKNYEAKNYHFAVVALHMIYMGIVYHYIYGIFRADKKRFEYILIGSHDFLESKGVKDFENLSWHNFSIINESQIFQFYRAVGISKGDIKILKKPVSERNDILHTNGKYLSSESDFEERTQVYLENLEKINEFCKTEYKKLFFDFLNDFGIEIQDQSEANEYLNQDFIKEDCVNLITLKELSKINKKDYPKNSSLLFNTIKKYI